MCVKAQDRSSSRARSLLVRRAAAFHGEAMFALPRRHALRRDRRRHRRRRRRRPRVRERAADRDVDRDPAAPRLHPVHVARKPSELSARSTGSRREARARAAARARSAGDARTPTIRSSPSGCFTPASARTRRQDFAAAATDFEQAYKALPLPEIAFSAAQAYRRQYQVDAKPSHVARAIELYRVVPREGRDRRPGRRRCGRRSTKCSASSIA